MLRRALWWIAALLLPGTAQAQAQAPEQVSVQAPEQTVVTSAAPAHVSVTVYRASGRSARDAMNLRWLQGYALVTETRSVTLPAGAATIRFEGVAGGILPESAIVTGLPDGVREKNLDADLLSPASLYAHGFARPVTLRRTDRDGRSVEEPAIIRSGPQGAAILETRAGIEVADCGPTRDTLVYGSVPEGLAAKPTLSVATQSARPVQATVTLSYLAWGFDWQANYVATLAPDGESADVTAWVTLASGDPTSFADADTQVVAGQVARGARRFSALGQTAPLVFQCFAVARAPMAFAAAAPPPPPPPPPPQPAPMPERIMVTARRVQQEELGDLKLYRVPEPTTLAAQSQKQVALLDQPHVPVAIVYTVDSAGEGLLQPQIVLRARNRQDAGLGLPLPAGPVALFQPRDGTPLLLGEATLADKAVGEDVEIPVGPASAVTAELVALPRGAFRLTLRNAGATPVAFEARLPLEDGARVVRASARLGRKDGTPLWQVQVPANGTAVLDYRVKPAR